MRVIITGGTGLIGRALSADLAADGHEVIVLSRAPERSKGLAAGVRAERWDGQPGERLGATLPAVRRRQDGVLCCAARPDTGLDGIRRR